MGDGPRLPSGPTSGGERGMHRSEHHSDPGARNLPTLRLLIVSEVRFVRESLAEVLGRGGNIAIVGSCADSAQGMSLSRELRPDMVLMDAAVHDGLVAVRRLRGMIGGLRVIVFA